MRNDSTTLHNKLLGSEQFQELLKLYPNWDDLPLEEQYERYVTVGFATWLWDVAEVMARAATAPGLVDEIPFWLLDEPTRNERLLSIFTSAFYNFAPELRPGCGSEAQT